MKKIVHRDILGHNPRKREVSVEEIVYRTEARINKKRICKYYIKSKFSSSDVTKLRGWINQQKRNGIKKDCHVLRRIDTNTGENKVVCKVVGEFFAVWGQTAYRVFYVNELKVELKGSKLGLSDRGIIS
jgi:hypothetical protein